MISSQIKKKHEIRDAEYKEKPANMFTAFTSAK